MTTSRPVALVTGASSGLGAEFARQLAKRKHDLVLVARREEQLKTLARRLTQEYGIEADVLAADLADDRDTETVARRISTDPRLELLVNNAGFGATGNLFQSGLDVQLRMHRVHVFATVRLTHAALTAMVPRKHGGVINVSSVAGFSPMPGHASYAATKAWMITFTECLHLELDGIGSPVRVQALCPGFTYTEFHDVLGLDRNKIMANRKWWMTSDFVVSESLKGFDHGDWLVIPGWRYRAWVRLLSVIPRVVMNPILIRVARNREAARR